MTEQQRVYHWPSVDKAAWGPGPWVDEPDKFQWVDEATGLDCLIVRNPLGALCGYVGVPEGHLFYGVDYLECPYQCGAGRLECEHTADQVLTVHGGITYADRCQDGPEDLVICHLPFPGRPEQVWWLGFDMAHSGDLVPEMEASRRRLDPIFRYGFGPLAYRESRDVYRTLDYVREQCSALARQLAEIGARRSRLAAMSRSVLECLVPPLPGRLAAVMSLGTRREVQR